MSQDTNDTPSNVPENDIPDATFAEPIGTTAVTAAAAVKEEPVLETASAPVLETSATEEVLAQALQTTPTLSAEDHEELLNHTASIAPIEEIEEEQITSTPYPDLPAQFQSQTVVQEYEVSREEGLILDPNAEHINLLALPIKDVLELSDKVPELSETDTAKANAYVETIQNATSSIPVTERFVDTVNRTTAQWRQYLNTEKGRVGFGSPKFSDKDATKVNGERAILRVAALLGKASLISIPLYHSGFWVTIKAPSDSELLEVRRRLMDDKIRLGRDTQGLVFSNTKAFTTSWILDLVISNLFDTTLKDTTDLRGKIKSPDLDVLFWGLACAIWPTGFQYSRSILTDEALKTKEIVHGKINISKLMWPDNSAFTDRQRAHMSNRVPGSTDNEAVQRYLDDFALYKGRKIEINENLSVILNVPGVEEYVKNGQRWVSDVVAMVDRTFTSEVEHADSRRIAINENALATALRQYSHWIESVVIEDVENKERDIIDQALELFSENVEIRNKIIKAVGSYIDDVTVAVIAIPESSGKETGIPRFPRLIPIDVGATFFTLLLQRINRILNS